MVVKLFLSIMLFGTLCSCSNRAENWQRVNLGNGQSMMIPSEWIVTQINDIFYFSNKPLDERDGIVYMFQSHSHAGSDDDVKKYGGDANGIVESNELCDLFQAKYYTYSAVKSNGAIYGISVVSVDGKEQIMSYIYLDEDEHDKPNMFYVWNDNIDQNMLIQIAETYRYNSEK